VNNLEEFSEENTEKTYENKIFSQFSHR